MHYDLYSTVSSSLSGCAANCWDDILKLKLSDMTEERKALVNRLLGMYTMGEGSSERRRV